LSVPLRGWKIGLVWVTVFLVFFVLFVCVSRFLVFGMGFVKQIGRGHVW